MCAAMTRRARLEIRLQRASPGPELPFDFARAVQNRLFIVKRGSPRYHAARRSGVRRAAGGLPRWPAARFQLEETKP